MTPSIPPKEDTVYPLIPAGQYTCMPDDVTGVPGKVTVRWMVTHGDEKGKTFFDNFHLTEKAKPRLWQFLRTAFGDKHNLPMFDKHWQLTGESEFKAALLASSPSGYKIQVLLQEYQGKKRNSVDGFDAWERTPADAQA